MSSRPSSLAATIEISSSFTLSEKSTMIHLQSRNVPNRPPTFNVKSFMQIQV